MNTSFYKNWLSLKVRRNRKSFLAAFILALVIYIALACIFIYLNPTTTLQLALGFLLLIPINICLLTLISQRLRDFNVTGWLALLILLPSFLDDPWREILGTLMIIFLCVMPGTKGANRYDLEPLHQSPN